MKDELPLGWALSTIGEVCSHPQYGWTTSASSSGQVRLLRTTDITSGSINWDSVPYCQDAPVDVDKYLLQNEDIVVSRAGSVGKSVLVLNPERAVFASYLIRFRPRINAYYLSHFLSSGYYWKQITEQAAGIAVPNINASKLRDIQIPIAPEAEQQRIVSKIDELFSRIDEGERALKRASVLVERYRQSVLKAAVTGELTRAWREKNKDTLESGEALLAQILTAHRAAWEKAELEKMKAKGITPANDNWKQNYEEPTPPKTTALPRLPDGWAWVTLPMLCSEKSTNGISVKGSSSPPGVPALRLDAILDSGFDYSARRYIPISEDQAQRLAICEGDLFISRANGSLHLVGRAVLANAPPEQIVFPDTMIRYRPLPDPDVRPWLAAVWPSRLVREQLERRAKTTAGIYKISQGDISEIAIPLPPLAEQAAAVSETMELMSRIAQLENDLRYASRESSALRQATLKCAFTGGLVPRLLTDEPASALLERIAAERNGEIVAPRRGRNRKTNA